MALDRVAITKVGKRYGTERALAEVTLELRAGSMCALLGHNGAGKTTLLGVVSTLVRAPRTARSRTSRVAPSSPVSMSAARSACSRTRRSATARKLSATENLELVAGLYGIAAQPKAELDRVGLDPKARDRAHRARTRAAWCSGSRSPARADEQKPSLVLLDEPFLHRPRSRGALALGAELGTLRDAGAIVRSW